MVGDQLAGCPDAFSHGLPLLGAGFVVFSVLAACVVQSEPLAFEEVSPGTFPP